MAISKKIEAFLSGASWIRKMFEEGEKLRKIYGDENVYDFTLGNPDIEPPKAFKDELKKFALDPIPGMHRYMSNAGYPETRRAVADVLAEQSGLPVNENHIIMTCGAGGALNVVLKSLLDQGDEVIILSPYFVEYKFYIDNHGGIFREVPTTTEFNFDLESIGNSLTSRTKAIIINSPNNPTGVVYDAASLESLGKLLNDHEKTTGNTVFLISDEPYAKIVYDGITVPNVFKLVKNSIIATSHSKDLAIPGERIGYIAISPNITNNSLLAEAMVFCNRTLGFVNAPALMQRIVKSLQRVTVDVGEYEEKRNILYENLTDLGFQMVKPQGAFYLFPKSPIPDDVEFVMMAQKHNILLVPGSGFGAPGYFRLSYCVDKKIIIKSLPAFRSLAKELGLAS